MDNWANYEEERQRLVEIMKQPVCHFTPMDFDWADDWPNGQVEFWVCRHCGHTKEICRHQSE